jgi:HSP20 family protein
MANVKKWDPLTQLASLQQQFFGDDVASVWKGVNIPTTDVYTKGNNLIVEAHLPNFDESDVDVRVDDGYLVISAARHETDEDKSKKYIVRESSSSFYRRIALPERADTDKISAKLSDGLLSVTVPLTPLPEPKKIAVAAKSKK